LIRIGLISDTHGYLDDTVFEHFKECNEIWHAGDFGNVAIADKLKAFKPLKGVYGNIDGYEIRSNYPESLRWKCEEVEIYMKHIGGYPPKYTAEVKKELSEHPVKLFISGNSHILKIMYDEKLKCLHINPGAAGRQGWHKIKTLLRFVIEGENIKDCEVIELPK